MRKFQIKFQYTLSKPKIQKQILNYKLNIQNSAKVRVTINKISGGFRAGIVA